jgi:hypothetical protein
VEYLQQNAVIFSTRSCELAGSPAVSWNSVQIRPSICFDDTGLNVIIERLIHRRTPMTSYVVIELGSDSSFAR